MKCYDFRICPTWKRKGGITKIQENARSRWKSKQWQGKRMEKFVSASKRSNRHDMFIPMES